jgi:hypothetical protein
MYNLVVNLYYGKDITRFGLNRAKIDKNHNIQFFCNQNYKTVVYEQLLTYNNWGLVDS